MNMNGIKSKNNSSKLILLNVNTVRGKTAIKKVKSTNCFSVSGVSTVNQNQSNENKQKSIDLQNFKSLYLDITEKKTQIDNEYCFLPKNSSLVSHNKNTTSKIREQHDKETINYCHKLLFLCHVALLF